MTAAGLLAAALLAAVPASVPAAPSAASLSASRARLNDAVAEYSAARRRVDAINARAAKASAELDRLADEQDSAQRRLEKRTIAVYRIGQETFVSVLLSSGSFEEFSARWALLERIAGYEADALADVKAARKRAKKSAQELLDLQEDAARELRKLAEAKAKAKRDLAQDKAAWAAYQDRIAASAGGASGAGSGRVTPKPISDRTGSGAWKTAVASHYGRNFSGRGASGKRIGPDSMMVAHKTLPFGTLVEIKYNGRTCVASVQDRGPYTKGRTFDLGPGVIRVLGFSGVHKIKYRVIGR